MLFVLRLLPSYKKWQQRAVNLAFLINFLITVYACVAFGVSCIPFRANWETVPNSRCFSKNLLVITNQVNAGRTYVPLAGEDSVLRLIFCSAWVRLRHCHRFDTSVLVVECTNEGENQKTAEHYLRSRSGYCSAEYCPCGYNHQEGTY